MATSSTRSVLVSRSRSTSSPNGWNRTVVGCPFVPPATIEKALSENHPGAWVVRTT